MNGYGIFEEGILEGEVALYANSWWLAVYWIYGVWQIYGNQIKFVPSQTNFIAVNYFYSIEFSEPFCASYVYFKFVPLSFFQNWKQTHSNFGTLFSRKRLIWHFWFCSMFIKLSFQKGPSVSRSFVMNEPSRKMGKCTSNTPRNWQIIKNWVQRNFRVSMRKIVCKIGISNRSV